MASLLLHDSVRIVPRARLLLFCHDEEYSRSDCRQANRVAGADLLQNGGAPVVRIFAARQKNNSGAIFPPAAGTAVLTMGDYCRLSGVAIDGGGLQMSGTTNGTSGTPNVITNLDPNLIKQVQTNDIVTAGDIGSGITVTGVNTGSASWGVIPTCMSPPCMILSAAPSGSNSELISFNGPSGVAIGGQRDTIDDHSLIENGFNNVFCINTNSEQAGLQLKEAQFARSGSDGLHLGGCPNVRVIGNIVIVSGGTAISYGGTDITVSNNSIEQSAGPGLDLTNAGKISVNGNFFDDNGQGLNGGPAIVIDNTSTASICNNHLTGNGEYASAAFPNPSQIYFAGNKDGIVFCGNAYGIESQSTDVTLKPAYVYDANPGTTLTNSHLYDSATPQVLGVYSPNAAPVLSQLYVPQVVPKQIIGFTLVNSGTTAVQMLAGTAADISILFV